MLIAEKYPVSRIEISRKAYQHNLRFIQSLLGKRCLFSSVIKANAYGHQISTFTELAISEGVKHFSVFNTEEAYQCLLSAKKWIGSQEKTSSLPGIMIMGDCEGSGLEWAIKNGIEVFMFDFQRLTEAIAIAKKIGTKAKIHIEVETGLNRTGFELYDFEKLTDLLKESSEDIEILGLCTHYAGAETIANYFRIQQQYKNYQLAQKRLKAAGIKVKRRHVLCSAGIINYPKMKMEMARVGVLQYGFWPTPETKVSFLTQHEAGLSPTDEAGHSYIHRLMSWKSAVMAIKDVSKGQFVGYGTSFMADRQMKIATIPVGYGYGYARSLSNQGAVLVKGIRCQVVGVVNMNVIMVDVTNVQNLQKGDEVILIGEENGQEISVSSFSDLSNQLNYEMLSRIPADIPRLIVD
jgi:alanine racemase